MAVIHAPESIRFYWPDGRPCFEVPSSDNKKMIEPDIRHARKHTLLPSVTTILKTIRTDDRLEKWAIEQHLKVAFEMSPHPPETEEEWIVRIEAEADIRMKKPADRGTEIHACVEEYLLSGTEPSDPVSINICGEIDKNIRASEVLYGKLVSKHVEFPVASPKYGYAGRGDLKLVFEDRIIYLDLKTTSLKSTKKPYLRHGCQLAAYDFADNVNKLPSDLVQIYADRDTGETKFMPWDEKRDYTREQLLKCFLNAADNWFIIYRHDPRPTCS